MSKHPLRVVDFALWLKHMRRFYAKVMMKDKYIKSVIQLAAFFLLSVLSTYSQQKKPTVSIKVDTDNYAVEGGRKSYLSSFNLYTVINGRKYFIARLEHSIVSIPEPLVDPTG